MNTQTIDKAILNNHIKDMLFEVSEVELGYVPEQDINPSYYIDIFFDVSGKRYSFQYEFTQTELEEWYESVGCPYGVLPEPDVSNDWHLGKSLLKHFAWDNEMKWNTEN